MIFELFLPTSCKARSVAIGRKEIECINKGTSWKSSSSLCLHMRSRPGKNFHKSVKKNKVNLITSKKLVFTNHDLLFICIRKVSTNKLYKRVILNLKKYTKFLFVPQFVHSFVLKFFLYFRPLVHY